MNPPVQYSFAQVTLVFAGFKWGRRAVTINMHFTPTSASWLNMVERFFRDLGTERLRRGVFTSVPELVGAIDEYVQHHNTDPKPFIWTRSARDILQKVIRANSKISSRQNETLHQKLTADCTVMLSAAY